MLLFNERYEEIRPHLQKELVDFLDAFTLKHASIPDKFRVSFKPFAHRQDFYFIFFHDDRFPEREAVGYVRWDFGKRASDFEYEIQSRLITNAKYSHWSREHHTARTKDMKKALKSALTHIKPWGYEELIADTREAVGRAHRKWVEEKQGCTYLFRPSIESMYKELKNLQAQGVTFETDEFKKAIASMDEYAELKRRQEARPNLTCVMYLLGKVIMQDGKTTNEFETDAHLDEHYKSRIALLKLVDDATHIPEIGYKVDADTFWIYNETNN